MCFEQIDGMHSEECPVQFKSIEVPFPQFISALWLCGSWFIYEQFENCFSVAW